MGSFFCKGALLSVLAVGLGAAGCGGGSGGSVPIVGGGGVTAPTSHIGMASLTYSGQPRPQSTSSSGAVSVIGQAGASYSTITLNPAPNLKDTFIAFSRSGASDQIYTVPFVGGGEQAVTHGETSYATPTCSPLGPIAAASTVGLGLISILADGSGLSTFSELSGYFYFPQYSPDGSKLLLQAGTGYLYWMPAAGGTSTYITQGDIEGDAWTASSASIAFCAVNGSVANIFTVPYTGGTPTNVTPTGLQTGSWLEPACSPDGASMVAVYSHSGSNSLVGFQPSNPSYFLTLTPSGFADFYPSFSPDGKFIAFYRSNAGGATPGIYITTAGGADTYLLLPDSTSTEAVDGTVGGISWSPFLQPQTVVGSSGGTLSTAPASGFLLGLNNGQFASIVSFTALDPSSAAVVAPGSSQDGEPLAFTLTADQITSLAWTNSYHGQVVNVTTSSSPEVVVIIDGSTGQVDSVVPAAIRASVTGSAAAKTYTGRFTGVYDKTGKNLAPGGAKQIVVDAKNGHLVSFR